MVCNCTCCCSCCILVTDVVGHCSRRCSSLIVGGGKNGSSSCCSSSSSSINDDYFELRNRTNPGEYTQIKARKIWDSLCLSSWSCGDPGIQMHDAINAWNTCPKSGSVNSSNPCSEVVILDDTACNLASLNLVKFQRADGRLDVDKLKDAARTWIYVLEISVYIAQYPSAQIAENHKIWTYRLRVC